MNNEATCPKWMIVKRDELIIYQNRAGVKGKAEYIIKNKGTEAEGRRKEKVLRRSERARVLALR
ncbi:MAG: hypothetical protein U9P14_11400 [Gemmatimonadota bacterium]|nr:hypothetical protein [Gemmatimonadota bacterium]